MSLFRNIVWHIRGVHTFTKKGYNTASIKFKAEDLDVDLSNTSIMITGAHTGVAKTTAVARKLRNN